MKDLSDRKLENFIKRGDCHMKKAWIVLSITTWQIRGGFTIFRFYFQFILYHGFNSTLLHFTPLFRENRTFSQIPAALLRVICTHRCRRSA